MTDKQIQQLIDKDFFIKKYGPAKLVETHISWVVLARDFVFKIKKPHHFSFLNFSTLERRKHYCERELALNRRLAPDMYLAVVPIKEYEGQLLVWEGEGQIIDYAVKMKRMDESRQMNLLLVEGKVTKKHLDRLAAQLAAFHKATDKVKEQPDEDSMLEDFSDILNVKDFIGEHMGTKGAEIIVKAVDFAGDFLNAHFKRILERHHDGFSIDGHGDLYSQNIFLPENGGPVIFDCIEFSDHFRYLDVLNELAFFCMDLEYYNRRDLAGYFLEKYNLMNPCFFSQVDMNLFNYYKLYRANVRAKVGALKAQQMKDEKQLEKQWKFVRDYLGLMERYLKELIVVHPG